MADDVTVVLKEMADGDEGAPDKLLPLVYNELRRLAGGYFKNERDDHTLQATELVHEAYIRLVDWENVSWQNRAHFFAVAAQVMRHILIDHARKKRANKRDGGQKLALDEALGYAKNSDVDLIALDDALQALVRIDGQQAKIVELRYFGGLSIEETAHVLKISPATVKRDWTVARMWLQRELSRDR
jgi:RNA polymerase sigma factor (TIGR02999 family)